MDFEAFPKIPRLNRDIVITEKIDGTNAAVLISQWDGDIDVPDADLVKHDDGQVSTWYHVQAQSRKRLITPESDNFGFARWVRENAEELVRLLGPGRHFGEWWGQGIQRGYGLDHKRFSLFNPERYAHLPATDSNLDIYPVPVLYEGPFSQEEIENAVARLFLDGSVAAPGFRNAEGIIVYHTAARQSFKVTVKDDEKPKGSTE